MAGSRRHSDAKWRLKRKGDGKSYGPYTEKQLRDFLREDRVSEEDLVSDGERTMRLGDLMNDSPAPPPPKRESASHATKDEAADDADTAGWSWGAFGLGLIWVVGNRVWWPGLLMVLGYVLLAGGITVVADTNLATLSSALRDLKMSLPGMLVGFLPFLAFSVYLGIKGHDLARRKRDFHSASQFKRTMRAWDKAGLAVAITVVALGAGSIPILRSSAIEAQGSSCLSNLKQMDLAMLMWAEDNGNRFPPHEGWQEAIAPYLNDENILQCPSGMRYVYNPTVAGRHLDDVSKSAPVVEGMATNMDDGTSQMMRFRGTHLVVLLYEVDSDGEPAFDAHPVVSIYDHGSGKSSSQTLDHMNVAFADGSCRAVSKAEADEYIWQLQ